MLNDQLLHQFLGAGKVIRKFGGKWQKDYFFIFAFILQSARKKFVSERYFQFDYQ